MTVANDRLITAEDIYNLELISEPHFSPDGTKIAYVVTTIEESKNDYRSSIYVTSADGKSQKRLTRADAKDGQPRWSPDGTRIAFTSNRSDKPQIWMLRADGGEAWQVSQLGEGVGRFEWSPDGATFVATSKATTESEASKDDKDKQDEEKSDVRHITKMRYRHDGQGFIDFKPAHLWLINAEDGAAQQLTDADINDDDPVWSPSGCEIAFVTNRSEEREMNTVSQVWLTTAAGKQERELIGGDDAHFYSPSWSPDGTTLAVIGIRAEGSSGGLNDNLWLVNIGDGTEKNLTKKYDRSISDSAMSDVFTGSVTRPIWLPDGSALLTLVSDHGSTNIMQIDAKSGKVKDVTTGEQRVSAFSLSADGKQIAYIAGGPTSPGNLFVVNVNGKKPTQLTNLNQFLEGKQLSQPEMFTVPSHSDGAPIQGWILKPPTFEEGKKYPMILEIHGGPHGMYSVHMMHEFQLMAARGYVVVYTNPRGSTGFGEDFTLYTHMAWGEKDMPDQMAAVDYVVSQGYVDENRLGVTGGSYGGYMTLWMIGHTQRFKAAVTDRCVSNLYSFYGTSDIGWFFGEYNFGGTPWENRKRFMKYSPITYVEDMHTPLLIVHSEEDYRCPIEQGEQVFISLKRLGREVEFVRFPGENHNLSRSGKPKHRIERLEHTIGWFDKHL